MTARRSGSSDETAEGETQMQSSGSPDHGMLHPDRWLAALRIGVGAWFLKGVVTKVNFTLIGGFLPFLEANTRWTRVMPIIVNSFSSEHPQEWYADFLVDTVVANGALFADLTAIGETAVGVGLLLGLATRPFALVGLTMMVGYGFANYWTGMGTQGFHFMLVLCMLAFLFAGAGRVWGVDGWLRRRYPDSLYTRLGLG